ncbi:YjjG family noncanonical pyrimidine nucleotidase [Thermophagus sp. OGC60D27]|uniref:YjjG family noncanonical pyrimidine nucleotidase n=1 Tax=Thermophagus sp. OGC60D27 TaxID=3458415 RepID=UPI0040377251
MTIPYKHLFFDLDHTIWDFDANQALTLKKLFEKYHLGNHFKDFDNFFQRYSPINERLWRDYQYGRISKKELKIGRFYQTFRSVGVDDFAMAERFSEDFVTNNSKETNVIPHAFELLNYLQQKKYHLYIITNGFRETQYSKLEKSGLAPYFEKTFISEDIGVNKPNPAFFEYSLKNAKASKNESLVIGDSLENDIKGARNSGIDQVFFNPKRKPHDEEVFKEITSLKELIEWL